MEMDMNTQQGRSAIDSHESARAYPPPWTGYSDKPQEMPLSGYAGLMGLYVAVFGTLLAIGARSGRLPDRTGATDIVLFGVATHKLGRIITKDWVTSPVRAPFTKYEKSLGGGEVAERSRGGGLRRAVGDLLTCPWCIAPWVASGLYAAFVVQPPATRLVAGVFASVALSDFLQHLYGAATSIRK
jgi:hypothetical protein